MELAFPFVEPVVDDDVLKKFGKRLRAVRTQQGLSQEALSHEAGLHRTFVGLIERGQRNITVVTVAKLATALGVTMAQLMPDAEDN